MGCDLEAVGATGVIALRSCLNKGGKVVIQSHVTVL